MDTRFPGNRATRLLLAIIVFSILTIRFGLDPDSADIRQAGDILILAASLLYLIGILLPVSLASLKDRLSEEKWLFLFSFLYILALLAFAIKLSASDNIPSAAAFRTVVRISIGYSILCSVRVMLASFGSWAFEHLSPAAILPVSFAIVILFGTMMLMMPASTPQGGIGLIDAAFTSTSATCVTGLIVRDTAIDFTLFGQIIILILIQVGGLGIMTFVAFFALFLGHNAGLRESTSLIRVMDSDFVSDLKKIMGSIIGWTLTIETAGAFILYIIWDGQPVDWTTNFKIWQSVFHSISAFCNAGFSLNPVITDASAGYFSNPTNLEGFAHVPGIAITIGSLIVLGGIGFMVLTSLGIHMMHRMRTGTSKRMSVQIKLILWVTCILIVAGMALFLILEWNNTLEGMTLSQKMANAYLGSVTPRTAGFNTVPTSVISPAMLWFFVALMFIGASPGGTGGGVKTITVGVLFMSVISLIRNKPATEVYKRRIPSHDIKRTAALLLLGGMAFTVSAGLLLISEQNSSSEHSTFDYIFESMSAFGTVGLSTGPTADLTWMGKVIIILTMFVGRIGPAALAAATGRRTVMRYEYPETRITIG
ncbi:MAG: Trk family potassium uptake protein [Candidatus Aegiribacteria sp.]|nr:Trk family potassium uptake protein [Candidatus Aegiribacteria sp.]